MEKYRKWLVQFIKYGMVGVSNTLVSLAAYYALVFFGLHYLAANTVGFLLGVLNSYYWNNKYVFKKTSAGHLRTLVRMYAGSGVTFVLGMGLLSLQVEYLGISEYAAPLINTVFVVGVGFLINKLWVFK